MIDWKEIIGLCATLFVLISFTQSDVKKIRYINMIGCILFVVYGVLIHSPSVWILNLICFILHIYKLVKKLDQISENNEDLVR